MRNIRIFFWHRKFTLKVKIWHFLTPPHYANSQNLYPPQENSTTRIAILLTNDSNLLDSKQQFEITRTTSHDLKKLRQQQSSFSIWNFSDFYPSSPFIFCSQDWNPPFNGQLSQKMISRFMSKWAHYYWTKSSKIWAKVIHSYTR